MICLESEKQNCILIYFYSSSFCSTCVELLVFYSLTKNAPALTSPTPYILIPPEANRDKTVFIIFTSAL